MGGTYGRASGCLLRSMARMVRYCISGFLWPSMQELACIEYFLISASWGPLIPMLQPLVCMFFFTHLLTYQVAISWFRFTPPEDELRFAESRVRPLIVFFLTLGYIITLLISLNMHLTCTLFLCVVTLLALLEYCWSRFAPVSNHKGEHSRTGIELTVLNLNVPRTI